MKIIKRYDFLVNFIPPLNIAVRCGDLTIALLTLKWMLHLQFSSISLMTHIFWKLRHQAIEIYPKNYFLHYFWYWKRPKTLPDLKVATLYYLAKYKMDKSACTYNWGTFHYCIHVKFCNTYAQYSSVVILGSMYLHNCTMYISYLYEVFKLKEYAH